jgi:hypothetical protein
VRQARSLRRGNRSCDGCGLRDDGLVGHQTLGLGLEDPQRSAKTACCIWHPLGTEDQKTNDDKRDPDLGVIHVKTPDDSVAEKMLRRRGVRRERRDRI